MYFGSVRFFKHLFLLILLLAIVIPTTLSISFGINNKRLNAEVNKISLKLQEIEQNEEQKEEKTEPEKTSPETPAYEELYPDMYVTDPSQEQEVKDGVIYLTFDDGPSDVTDSILDTLSSKNAKATFFIVGNQLDSAENQEHLKRIAADGHTIGIHTQSHDYKKIYASVDDYLEDFYAAWSKVKDITGVAPEIFRFPGGSLNSYNQFIYKELISEMLRRGFRYYDWNISSQDAAGSKATPVDSIVSNSTAIGSANRAIILMHDSATKSTTAQALPKVIDTLASRGFTFEGLSKSTKAIVFSYTE